MLCKLTAQVVWLIRLDRLVGLLDSGTTTSIRQAAASQLGQIAATRVAHPSVDHSATITNQQAQQLKQEPADRTGPRGGEAQLWSGVEGEWNEVVGLVQRVTPTLVTITFTFDWQADELYLCLSNRFSRTSSHALTTLAQPQHSQSPTSHAQWAYGTQLPLHQTNQTRTPHPRPRRPLACS